MPIPPGSLRRGAIAALLLLATASAQAARVVIPLNDGWRFVRGDAGVFASSRDWEAVQLPHTWNARDGQAGPAMSGKLETERQAVATLPLPRGEDKEHLADGYYRGACWYERTLEIPPEWKGRRVFVRFEAASTVARVFVNGMMLGEHRGGFTAFCFELTDVLRNGGVNNLRVQVDNSAREDLPPLSGDFNLFGGLYRPAALIVTNELCISPLDYASPGVYLTTKELGAARALVEVRAILSDHAVPKPAVKPAPKAGETPRPRSQPVEMRVEVADQNGSVVGTAKTAVDVPAGGTVDATVAVSIPAPRLWQGRADPHLYRVSVQLARDGTVLDEVTQPLGLRTVAIDEARGFLLNGKPYPVRGVNRHQDVRDKGWAISAGDEERDAALMKEMGVTAVRNAHYPQSENWHRINDREGVLLWDEVSLVNETRSNRAFWLNGEECLREMIHQLYNHPSVAWWGIFNELGNRPTPPSDEGLARLRDIARELDSSRLVVGATNHLNRSFNRIPPFICLNAYPAWYSSAPPESLAKTIAALSAEVGGRRVGVSEYGAGANVAHHLEGELVRSKPGGPFHPEEWQAHVHEGTWAAIRDNHKVWGSFAWNMFDFAVQGRREGNLPALNDKGLVTHDRRIRKDAFYFYQANWTSAPMVRITSSRLTPRVSAQTDVKIYSNCDEVELRLNGATAGKGRPDEFGICRFPAVSLRVGENEVEAIGRRGSSQVADTCRWTVLPGEE